MSVDEIKAAAFRGDVPPPGLSMPERILWWSLRDLYKRYRAGDITHTDGEKESSTIYAQYNADKSKSDLYESLIADQAKYWKEIEQTAREYAADRSIEKANAFWEAVYRCSLRRQEIEL